ncbi:SixA phosphatase family protein [Promicromonospora citrea]|uniref:Phosphohistidine phosphatase n=1 Tax=Promicromonospora citrea TaxID=43677 RepID=A0A8H9L4V6_9MICO|nr:histidine phosphatase family protein [Promicromonospora citrea]NNH54209.1 histidine phosphatase family protein [Promicromonospora citrea]GGM34527.1 phosphohistidine phosphatase [Promicromonospora citrea]
MGTAPGTEPATSPVRRLVLLRHAKAEPPSELPDEQRPLALRGRDQAVKVGAALAEAGLVPDAVVVSGAVRTRQTWDLARKHLGEPPVVYTDDLLGAMPRGVLAIVREVAPEARTVLVVGHEPAMAGTAELLAGPGSADDAIAQVRVGVPTATYSVLEAELAWSDWDRRQARLLTVTRPAS